jgi:membrane-associated phospholipid phosphatase
MKWPGALFSAVLYTIQASFSFTTQPSRGVFRARPQDARGGFPKSVFVRSLLLYLLLLLFVLPFGAFAQSSGSGGPYQLSLQRELLLSGIGAGTLGLGSYLQNQLDADRPLLRNLSITDYEEINGFDRLGTNLSNENARRWSDHTRNAGILAGGLLIFSREARRDAPKLALLYTETMLLTSGVTNLIKTTARRSRPYVYAPDWDPERQLSSGDRASFVSGHTSIAAASTFFFATVFKDYYPDSKLKPYVWGVAATIPAVTGYLRVRAARHFPSDIIAGYALGAGIGYLVPTLHKQKVLPAGMTIAPAGGGLYLGYWF